MAAEWNKKWGLKIKLEIPFFLLPPHSPPQISNKRRPLFFKTPTTFWSVWMELTDNWHLYPSPPTHPETHFGPLGCNLWWCWQQKLLLVNVLVIATRSIVSANVLWQWTSMQLFNRSCFVVFLRYVLCFVASQSGKTSFHYTYKDFKNGSWSRIQQN